MDVPLIPLVSSIPSSSITVPGRIEIDGTTSVVNEEHWYDSAKSIIENMRKGRLSLSLSLSLSHSLSGADCQLLFAKLSMTFSSLSVFVW